MNAARRFKTRSVDKSSYRVYFKKAKEFYQTMYAAEKAGNWNAVGLNGVHCVISLIDALLVRHSGIRPSGEDHMAVVDLLTSSVAEKLKNVKGKGQIAMRVIAKKNLVEYENRDFLKGEAQEMIKRVQRFYEWALGQL